MEKITPESWRNLQKDVAYLKEELQALKPVISAIPARERPLGQESVIDMIVQISFRQREWVSPAILQVIAHTGQKEGEGTQGKTGDTLSQSATGHIRSSGKPGKKGWDPERYDEMSIHEIIDMISDERSSLVELLERIPVVDCQKKISVPNGEEEEARTVYELVSTMVEFERKQLKLVAQRVLSIDLERHTVADHPFKSS